MTLTRKSDRARQAINKHDGAERSDGLSRIARKTKEFVVAENGTKMALITPVIKLLR